MSCQIKNTLAMSVIIIEPLQLPEIEISEETLIELDEFSFEEGQVTVHCSIAGDELGILARIWPTTFLVDKSSGYRSQLVHKEGITFYPNWTPVPANSALKFSLIFSPLPKTCIQFDLLEDIPQSGGFLVSNIQRNNSDVYNVWIQ